MQPDSRAGFVKLSPLLIRAAAWCLMTQMTELNDIENTSEKALSKLVRLAAVIGCSVEDFSKSEPEGYLETVELMRLWLMITNAPDRQKVLAYLKNIADRQAF